MKDSPQEELLTHCVSDDLSTPLISGTAEPQRPAPPRELEFTPAGAAEFVICDHTIETFFSDPKRRGCHLHQSHRSEPTRLSRLLMAACLAYLWIIYLGALCEQDGWISLIQRGARCDLSLFQLGLRLLEHLLNEDRAIPVAFYVSI